MICSRLPIVPDDGFATSIVPVDSAEHFTTFATNDNLCKAVVVAVGALFTIGTGFAHSSACQFFLHPQEDILWNDCFVVALHIVLRNNTVVLDSGLVQKVCGISFLKQGITDVFLVAQDLVAGAGPPFCFASTGENVVCFQTFCYPVHRVTLQVFLEDALYNLHLLWIDDEIPICIIESVGFFGVTFVLETVAMLSKSNSFDSQFVFYFIPVFI